MKLGGLQKCSLIDYPGHICAIVFTIGCNFRCPYCHNPELVEETAEELPVADFFSFIEQRTKQLDAVTVTGGEPTQHDDLLDFLTRIKALGLKVKLDTNGTRPQVVAEAIERKLVDYFAMDIKAPFAKYGATVNRPVDVEKLKQSMQMIMDSGVDYEFRTTVVKALLSPEDIEQIGQEIKGAKNYYLQKFVPTKLLNPAFRRKTMYTDDEFAGLLQLVQPYVQNCGIR